MIQIDEMLMRVPAMQKEAAGLLGREVADLVAAGLPADMGDVYLPELAVNINAASIAPGTSLAAGIAAHIIRNIQLAVYK